MLLHENLSSQISQFSRFKLGLIIGFGLLTVSSTPLFAYSEESAIVEQQPLKDRVTEIQRAQTPSPNSLLSDGIYLYGQSPKPEELGQEYLVFKVQRGKIIGAFYMPQSEFNCFSGTLDARQMNLSIVDPYDNTIYPYSIALQNLSPIANHDGVSREVELQGYHQIQTISDNDRRILNLCLENYR